VLFHEDGGRGIDDPPQQISEQTPVLNTTTDVGFWGCAATTFFHRRPQNQTGATTMAFFGVVGQAASQAPQPVHLFGSIWGTRVYSASEKT